MKDNKKVIYVDGTFDLIHSGHISFLKKCKSYGDYLIVGIIDDKDVKTYKREPVINLENRKIMIENISFIDKIIAPCPFNGISEKFICENDIDLIVYASPNGKECWVNHYRKAIDMKIMKYEVYDDSSLSTTQIINKIKKKY